MSQYKSYVGMDIAARWADIAWGQTVDTIVDVGQYPRTPTGVNAAITALIQRVDSPATTLILMEATGTYWMEWAVRLHAAGFVVSVVNAKHTYHYAKSQRQRAKTDRLDARMLTRYAITDPPPVWSPPPAQFEELQQRLTLRDDLIKTRTTFKNRLHALQQRPTVIACVAEVLRAEIQQLTEHIDRLETEIAQLLHADHSWAPAARRLLSIHGIGIITAAWILTATLNFAGCTTPQEAASFAGLAPHPRQSGSSTNTTYVIGNGQGHADLRNALYMATLSGIQHNPILKAFYYRLVDRGKLPKVARCATARKLLHIAWAVVVKDCDFDPCYGQASHSLENLA